MERTEALALLRESLKRAGGIGTTADRAGISVTYLSTLVNGGRPMGRETALKLRPLIDLPAAVWGDLLVPVAAEADETSATA